MVQSYEFLFLERMVVLPPPRGQEWKTAFVKFNIRMFVKSYVSWA